MTVPAGMKLVHRVGQVPRLEEQTDADRLHGLDVAVHCAPAWEAWRSATDALSAATGLKWSVWQTGGMCLLLGATINEETGAYMMLGDTFGPIDHTRVYDAEHGPYNWMLGLYCDADDEGVCLTLGQQTDRPDQDGQMAEQVAAVLRFVQSAARVDA